MKRLIELKDDGYCFVCGRLNPAGLHLSFEKSQSKVITSFTPKKEYQGYADIIHGGIITTVLDEAMVKVCILNGINAMTAEITVRFKKPLLTGTTCRVEAWINSEGSRLIEAEAVMKDQDGDIVAFSKAKLIPSEGSVE